MIVYTMENSFTNDDIIELFHSVNWESAKRPESLYKALINSTRVYSAWDEGRLIGLINALSDGYMTVYFHYMLIHPEYQRRGIGKELLQRMLNEFSDIPTKVLISYNHQQKFYENCGFTPSENTIPMFIKSSLESV